MIGVVVPAHNEETHLPGCLQALLGAARHLRRSTCEDVEVVVVADACTDRSDVVARRFGVRMIASRLGNVGVARALGAEQALMLGSRWLAFTDADSIVAPDWLSSQLALRSDVVCGTVAIRDWAAQSLRTRLEFGAQYRDRDDHRHVHGANLGVSAQAYRRVGGFRAEGNHEDVDLVERLRAAGCTIAWSASPRVYTSARRDFRCTAGFGAHLTGLGSRVAGVVGHE